MDLNEQIEEVRELLYDIVKRSENGVDSMTLAQECTALKLQTFNLDPFQMIANLFKQAFRRDNCLQVIYIADNLFMSILAWLRYVKAADEFEVRQRDGQTIISVVQQVQPPVMKDLNISDNSATSVEPPPPVMQETIDLEPLPLSSMPTPNSRSKVHVLSVTDPENLSIRLTSLDPMPDYLYAALSKDFNDIKSSSPRILPTDGLICVGKLPNGSWERLKLIRRSTLNKNFFIVYAVDVGIYHLVHENNLHPLSPNLHAFKNFLLAKCKVSSIRTKSNHVVQLSNIGPTNKKFWSREAQQALSDWFSNVQGTEVEMIPRSEWTLTEGPSTVPFVSADLIINGENIADKLVSMGFAEKTN